MAARLIFPGNTTNFSYGVDPHSEQIDYDQVRKIALECKPKLIVAGASAYPRILDFPGLRRLPGKSGRN